MLDAGKTYYGEKKPDLMTAGAILDAQLHVSSHVQEGARGKELEVTSVDLQYQGTLKRS